MAESEKIVPRLTKEQAAIIGAFTGISCGPFADVHELAEKKLRRPIWTHQFANSELWAELKLAVRPDFLALCYEEENDADHDQP